MPAQAEGGHAYAGMPGLAQAVEGRGMRPSLAWHARASLPGMPVHHASLSSSAPANRGLYNNSGGTL